MDDYKGTDYVGTSFIVAFFEWLGKGDNGPKFIGAIFLAYFLFLAIYNYG